MYFYGFIFVSIHFWSCVWMFFKWMPLGRLLSPALFSICWLAFYYVLPQKTHLSFKWWTCRKMCDIMSLLLPDSSHLCPSKAMSLPAIVPSVDWHPHFLYFSCLFFFLSFKLLNMTHSRNGSQCKKISINCRRSKVTCKINMTLPNISSKPFHCFTVFQQVTVV